MALFGLFKKKAPEAPPMMDMGMPASATMLPTDQVASLRREGRGDADIMQILQAQGYTPQQIYDAMAQAGEMAGPEPYTPVYPQQAPMPPPPMGYSQSPQAQQASVEETVEAVVEEKWHDLQRELGKFGEWKERVDSRLDKIEQSLADAKAELDTLHKAIVSKLGDYDKSLLDVGTEIKAMEKVFQKVLPELTTNVQELSRISAKAREKAAAPTLKKR